MVSSEYMPNTVIVRLYGSFIPSCRTAPTDLVFILDGSYSVGPENFEIVKKWLVNITKNFDIGPKFIQVGVVQYSDYPVLEIPLGSHKSGENLMVAMESIHYLGGNTRTGKAIQFALDYLFAKSSRFLTKIAVVLTDGKSQDEVKDAAEAARDSGITLFAIGVGSETEEAELRAIANKPSSTYVFYVEDYIAISKIREVMKQKLCEGKPNVFPEGLPPSYVFVSTQRFKVKKMWDLWRILTIDGRPQIAVTLNGVDKTLLFTTTSNINGSQVVTFADPRVKTLFDEGWHQIRLLVTEQDVTLFIDDQQIENKPLHPVLGIFISGQTQIGKYSGKEETVQFDVQKLRIYCDPEQNNRETACEIPGFNGECLNGPSDVGSTAAPCICPPGKPGLQGPKAPLSTGFSTQEYWTGYPIPSPGESSRPRNLTGVSSGKESSCNVGDPGLIPGSERSPGEGTDGKESACNVGDLGSIPGVRAFTYPSINPCGRPLFYMKDPGNLCSHLHCCFVTLDKLPNLPGPHTPGFPQDATHGFHNTGLIPGFRRICWRRDRLPTLGDPGQPGNPGYRGQPGQDGKPGVLNSNEYQCPASSSRGSSGRVRGAAGAAGPMVAVCGRGQCGILGDKGYSWEEKASVGKGTGSTHKRDRGSSPLITQGEVGFMKTSRLPGDPFHGTRSSYEGERSTGGRRGLLEPAGRWARGLLSFRCNPSKEALLKFHRTPGLQSKLGRVCTIIMIVWGLPLILSPAGSFHCVLMHFLPPLTCPPSKLLLYPGSRPPPVSSGSFPGLPTLLPPEHHASFLELSVCVIL
ncbi:hypothetical protein FD755_022315 [Muntiacus reevesi]|uniref:Collagen alpha-1(XXI) chain n=1 Tax=Muntiacus reevesi TaxID=9886 RepID=A0A5N3VZM9_MUNRE|nr:hypothetical protein FD755_022315 [Muntiacus reevesi]